MDSEDFLRLLLAIVITFAALILLLSAIGVLTS